MDLEAMGLNSAESIHTLVEAMNLADRDRNSELGDPDQVAVPVHRLTSKAYDDSLRPLIRYQKHTPSAALGGTAPLPANSTSTTHLSVADQQGSLVALPTTLNFAYGNGVAIPGTGVLLNSEMDDFSAKPGVPNAYGLVQGGKERHRPRAPAAEFDDTHRGAEKRWQPVVGYWHSRGKPHHHHGVAGAAQPHGARPQLGHIGVESAHPQPALA